MSYKEIGIKIGRMDGHKRERGDSREEQRMAEVKKLMIEWRSMRERSY